MSVRLQVELLMSSQAARSVSPAWSYPVAWWWSLLTLVSGLNIAAWCWLYRTLQSPGSNTDWWWMLGLPLRAKAGVDEPLTAAVTQPHNAGMELMLLLSAAYVFGCAFRSFLPRADVQRICLFDSWLSKVVVGRSVATVAELCFAAQWVLVLQQLGETTGAVTVLNAAQVVMPLIVIAECVSWYAVLTRNNMLHGIENSLWAIAFSAVGIGFCRLLFEFDGVARGILIVAIVGIACYLAFLITVDVPMYFARWRSKASGG